MDRVAVFIDGANLFHMQKKHFNWVIDLAKLLVYCSQIGQIVDAYFYTGIAVLASDAQRKFIESLPDMGYVAITKPLKKSGESYKANLDVEIVLDMFNTIDTYDIAILVSGDSDFERALQLLRARGKRFMVMSSKSVVAKELRAIAGRHYIDFEDIKDFVELRSAKDQASIEYPEELSGAD